MVDRATDLLEAELAEMVAVMPTSDRDRQLVEEYRGYFEIMIADRRAYTERLRAFELGPYLETKVDGGPVTNVLLDFANGNRMPACRPPGELGGDTYLSTAGRRTTGPPAVTRVEASPSTQRRITFAGLPAATLNDGIVPVTTEFAPIVTCSPICAAA